MIKILILIISIIFTCNVSHAQDEIMSEKDFNLNVSLFAIDSIQKSLASFSDMTDIVITDDKLDEIYSSHGVVKISIDSNKFRKIEKKELDWVTQNKINPNNILLIKGTLLKMDMEVNQMKYENAQLKKSKISKKELELKKLKYIKSKEKIEIFIKTHYWYE